MLRKFQKKAYVLLGFFYFCSIRLSYSIHQKLVNVYFHTKISLYKGYSYLKKQNLNKERFLMLEKSFI